MPRLFDRAPRTMFNYDLFGGRLASDIPLPGLRESDLPRASWRLRASDAPAGAPDGELLGEQQPFPGLTVRVYRHAGGFRIQYSDAGCFDVAPGGADITWHRVAAARAEDVRDCVIGRVLSTALHAAGMLCLHGSAVALDGAGVAFLAPQFHGKSTLALALAGAGGRLITDDTVLVEPSTPPNVWPGVHSVRLFGDSVGRLSGEAAGERETFRAKRTIDDLPAHQLMTERAPLAALYLLTRLAPESAGGAAVRRSPCSGAAAAVSVVRHAKVGYVLGDAESAKLFDRVIEVARTVPIYRLEVLRDFDRLGDVVAEITGWHCRTAISGRAP